VNDITIIQNCVTFDLLICAPLHRNNSIIKINSINMTNSPAITPNSLKGNWNEQKGKLKAKFPILTDADLQYENGKKDEMLTKVQKKLGKTKEELYTVMSGL
jgi:uncharacterized protein YjbJ (UPF0337 family)